MAQDSNSSNYEYENLEIEVRHRYVISQTADPSAPGPDAPAETQGNGDSAPTLEQQDD